MKSLELPSPLPAKNAQIWTCDCGNSLWILSVDGPVMCALCRQIPPTLLIAERCKGKSESRDA